MTAFVDIALKVAAAAIKVANAIEKFRRKKTPEQQVKISAWSKAHYFPDADLNAQCFYCSRFRADRTPCDGRNFS